MNVLINELRKVIIATVCLMLNRFEEIFNEAVDELGFKSRIEKEISTRNDTDLIKYLYSLIDEGEIIFTIKIVYSNYSFSLDHYNTNQAKKAYQNKIKSLKYTLLDRLETMIAEFMCKDK